MEARIVNITVMNTLKLTMFILSTRYLYYLSIPSTILTVLDLFLLSPPSTVVVIVISFKFYKAAPYFQENAIESPCSKLSLGFCFSQLDSSLQSLHPTSCLVYDQTRK